MNKNMIFYTHKVISLSAWKTLLEIRKGPLIKRRGALFVFGFRWFIVAFL